MKLKTIFKPTPSARWPFNSSNLLKVFSIVLVLVPPQEIQASRADVHRVAGKCLRADGSGKESC